MSKSNVLSHRIDFVMLISATNCNPNGSPDEQNRPRTSSSGTGYITPMCLKRKMRNWLHANGYPIFVQSEELCDDGYSSLMERAVEEIGSLPRDEYYKKACELFYDVRAFGGLFAYKDKDSKSVSVGVRGPVSIQEAYSVSPVEVVSTSITKSVNGQPPTGKSDVSSDRIGTKQSVRYGLYKTAGSISVQLAEKNGFTEADADALFQSLIHIFDNDASAARPAGSMVVEKIYWWEHDSKTGNASVFKVHNSVEVREKNDLVAPLSFDDYEIVYHEIPGLTPVIFDGRAD